MANFLSRFGLRPAPGRQIRLNRQSNLFGCGSPVGFRRVSTISGRGRERLCYSDGMQRIVRNCLFLSLLLGSVGVVWGQAGEQALDCEARSLRRQDLPDDFPFVIFEEGFAVLEVRCTNRAVEPQEIDPDRIQVFSPDKKSLEQARGTDIAPRLVKYYTRGGGVHPSIHGEARNGYPYPPDPNRARYEATRPTVGVPGHAGTVDAGAGPALRSTLEEYRVKKTLLESGGELHGYLYVESKKSGNKLSGGHIVIDDLQIGF